MTQLRADDTEVGSSEPTGNAKRLVEIHDSLTAVLSISRPDELWR